MKRLVLLGIVLIGTSAVAQDVMKTLSKTDAEMFARIVALREGARENFVVTTRLLQEKQSNFRSVSEVLDKEHGVKPDFPYTYDIEEKALFQLSTNAVKKGEQPARTLVKRFKTGEEALPLATLMLKRQRVESHIIALAQIAEEQREENARWDEHLRKTFSLEPMTRYQIKKVNDDQYQLVLVKETAAASPTSTPSTTSTTNRPVAAPYAPTTNRTVTAPAAAPTTRR